MSKFRDKNGNVLLDTVRLLVYKKKVANVQYDTFETGLYAYGSYATGAPTDWAGTVLNIYKPTEFRNDSDNDTSIFKIAFDRTGIYAMRFNEEGVSQTSWVKIVSF